MKSKAQELLEDVTEDWDFYTTEDMKMLLARVLLLGAYAQALEGERNYYRDLVIQSGAGHNNP